MNNRLLHRVARPLLALATGVVLAASFPKVGLSWLAWLVPGALVLLSFGQSRAKVFGLGYLAGLAHYLVSLYWLLIIPLPVKAVIAWLGVAGILALYPAIWLWFCWWTGPANQQEQPAQGVSWALWPFILWPLICACAWIAMEMGIARIFTGFPWNLLGASQYRDLALIQIASVTGVYGVSFMIVWVSVSLGLAVRLLVLGQQPRVMIAAGLAAPLLVTAVVIGLGVNHLAQPQPTGRELKVALVQPSIPQPVIWDPNEKTNRFNKLVALSKEAVAATHPELLVWPEAALPNMLTRFNPLTYQAVTNLVLPNHLWMILGADDAEPKKNSPPTAQPDFFNSAFLVEPGGQLVGRYHKRRLVILGEYMPLARWLPFLKYLRTVEGGFTAGAGPVPFALGANGAKLSVLICFEDVFPHVAREAVDDDTDFLLNLTNNGWFGESAAQWQHAVNALFRAVENGVPLVRCTNNGLTCWIDKWGRLHDTYFPGTKDIYGPGFKSVQVPLRPPGTNYRLTFYHHYGDLFGWTCVGITGIALGQALVLRRRPV